MPDDLLDPYYVDPTTPTRPGEWVKFIVFWLVTIYILLSAI